jgi:hypothetical protein
MNQLAGWMKMPLPIIVVLVPFQPGMGQPFPDNDHQQGDDQSEHGPEAWDTVPHEDIFIALHEEVDNRQDNESGEKEPLHTNAPLMQIFKEPGHHPPPTSLVNLRKKSG